MKILQKVIFFWGGGATFFDPHCISLSSLFTVILYLHVDFQVKLVMSLLSDDVLDRGQEVTKDILRQMKYIPSESNETAHH